MLIPTYVHRGHDNRARDFLTPPRNHKRIKTTRNNNVLTTLPNHLLAEVFNFLDYQGLGYAALTSKRWHTASYLTKFYEEIVDYSYLLHPEDKDKDIEDLIKREDSEDFSRWREPLFLLAKAQFLIDPTNNFCTSVYKVNFIFTLKLLIESAIGLNLRSFHKNYNEFLRIKLHIDHSRELKNPVKSIQFLKKFSNTRSIPQLAKLDTNYYMAFIKYYNPMIATISQQNACDYLDVIISCHELSAATRDRARTLKALFYLTYDHGDENIIFQTLENIEATSGHWFFLKQLNKVKLRVYHYIEQINDNDASTILNELAYYYDDEVSEEMRIQAQTLIIKLFVDQRIAVEDDQHIYELLERLRVNPAVNLNTHIYTTLSLAELISFKRLTNISGNKAFDFANKISELENLPLESLNRANMIKARLIIQNQATRITYNAAFRLLNGLSYDGLTDVDLLHIPFYKALLKLENRVDLITDDQAFVLFSDVISHPETIPEISIRARINRAALLVNKRVVLMSDQELFNELDSILLSENIELKDLPLINLYKAQLIIDKRVEEVEQSKGRDLLLRVIEDPKSTEEIINQANAYLKKFALEQAS